MLQMYINKSSKFHSHFHSHKYKIIYKGQFYIIIINIHLLVIINKTHDSQIIIKHNFMLCLSFLYIKDKHQNNSSSIIIELILTKIQLILISQNLKKHSFILNW